MRRWHSPFPLRGAFRSARWRFAGSTRFHTHRALGGDFHHCRAYGANPRPSRRIGTTWKILGWRFRDPRQRDARHQRPQAGATSVTVDLFGVLFAEAVVDRKDRNVPAQILTALRQSLLGRWLVVQLGNVACARV